MYVALNITASETEVTFPVDQKAGSELTDLYSGKYYVVSDTQEVTITIPAAADGGTVIFYVNGGGNNSKILIFAGAIAAAIVVVAGIIVVKKKVTH